MSDENITQQAESTNDEKVIIKLNVNRPHVQAFLQQINAPFPPVDQIDEVHLVITEDDINLAQKSKGA